MHCNAHSMFVINVYISDKCSAPLLLLPPPQLLPVFPLHVLLRDVKLQNFRNQELLADNFLW